MIPCIGQTGRRPDLLTTELHYAIGDTQFKDEPASFRMHGML